MTPSSDRPWFQRAAWYRGILVVGAVVAYANTFSVPLLFDDHYAIVENPSIRRLDDLRVLFPPASAPTAGRPLLNVSFAVNYALGGSAAVAGYHAFNLAVHLAAGLVLFGLVRRTLILAASPTVSHWATPLAGCAAILWTWHPLATAAVTYVSQRAESMMALCYLLTLYAFVRGANGGRGWLWVSVVACLAGMACKEVMVTAPLTVLMLDRAYVAPSFRAALRQRRWYYAGLAGGWVVLGWLVRGAALGARDVGFGSGVEWFRYLLAEGEVVLSYLSLALWPEPLIFDRGVELLRQPLSAHVPAAVAAVALVAAAAWLWHRAPRLGFLAAAFFVLLSPTSSVVPIAAQPMAESRMYLPLACVVVGAVLVGFRVMGSRVGAVIVVLLAIAGAWGTHVRNREYRSAEGLWRDTVAKAPANARAHHSLGNILSRDASTRAVE